ncbi:MAG: ABC transporter permease [Planctomycetota bacterium]|nr:MAG: ABC transporter permease [Planctomycetota bacterium]
MFSGLAIETIRIGVKSIRLHKLRSFLTALGIICGVGAVICMLSISEGASEAEMILIRLLGTQNVIVRSIRPQGGGDVAEEQAYLLDYGLNRTDLAIIENTIPHIQRVVPLREVAYEVSFGPKRFPVKVVGTLPTFFKTIHVNIAQGRAIQPIDNEKIAKVCVIGDEIRAQLFAYQDPIGRSITVSTYASGTIPFKIVGVLERIETAGTPPTGIGGRNLNNDVFIPLSTAEKRYGDLQYKRTSGSREIFRCIYSDFYVQVDELSNVIPVSEMVNQALTHGHTKSDYTVKVPYERLKIAENEKRRRRIILGAIAGISLIVGGIGIMNIMLATVTERTQEIGIRRALGAKRRHITMQFLIESLILSTVGGMIGVIVGSVGAHLITDLAGWPTIIHLWTILVSFGLALAVGLFFGIYPASAAARLDPIEALRHT